METASGGMGAAPGHTVAGWADRRVVSHARAAGLRTADVGLGVSPASPAPGDPCYSWVGGPGQRSPQRGSYVYWRYERECRANGSRGLQLVAGIACMMAIANLQYGWTLFVDPIHQQYQWSRAAIQLAFTLFILMETWLVPVEGWLIDTVGLRAMVLMGWV